MKTEMSLPGPALQEESQIWEKAVTVTVIGSECEETFPVAVGAGGGRRPSSLRRGFK